MAASAMSAMELPPSDQSEWLWQSPRSSALSRAAVRVERRGPDHLQNWPGSRASFPQWPPRSAPAVVSPTLGICLRRPKRRAARARPGPARPRRPQPGGRGAHLVGLRTFPLEQVGDAAKRCSGSHRLFPQSFRARLGTTGLAHLAVSDIAAATARREARRPGHVRPVPGVVRSIVAASTSPPMGHRDGGAGPARSRWSAHRDRRRRPRPTTRASIPGRGYGPSPTRPRTPSCGERSG